MKLKFLTPHKSINGPVTNEDIANFVVLSGPNGSGKSNLLEAINSRAIEIEGITTEGHPAGVRLFALAQLVPPPATASLAPPRFRQVSPPQAVEAAIHQLTQSSGDPLPGSDELEQLVRANLVQNRMLSPADLDRMLSASGKRLIDFEKDDFRRYSPLTFGPRDPFALSIGQLFVTYHLRYERNQYDQWREETKGVEQKSLTDEEFVATFGPPPWDLFNETLSLVGLEYRFEAPGDITDEQSTYEPLLVHFETGAQIRTDQLSSGEKTLLFVAMSLYIGSRPGEVIELPKVLLLDEPDASLHPSMIQSLLRVLDDIFCQRYGVKVILATHSPTTVALAPEESIYTMRRVGSPRVRLVSRDEALSSLLVGLPTLSVRNEYRRQVFVESEYDEDCYQELFRLLRPKMNTQLSLEFIASGRRGQGNCEAVKHLVTSMRNSGNPVQGILDRDYRQGAPDGIKFVAGRRSLENLILDPIAVALFLLREGFVNAVDMVGTEIRHFQLSDLHAQAAADYVTSRTKEPGDDVALVTVGYAGGHNIAVPRFVLDIKGHEWETRLLDAFQPLRKFDKSLKLRVIQRALADTPHWIPQDANTLFKSLLS